MEKVEISQEQAVAHLAALLEGKGNLELRVAFVGNQQLYVAELVARSDQDVVRIRPSLFNAELTASNTDHVDTPHQENIGYWLQVWNELFDLEQPRYFLVHTPPNVHEEEAIRKALRKKKKVA